VRVSLEYDWVDLGTVRSEDSKLVFPKAPDAPGVYRFLWTEPAERGCAYIGETDRLIRQFRHYRTPGTSQHTYILNAAVRGLIAQGVEVRIAVVTEASWTSDDAATSRLDLTLEPARLLVESAALLAARDDGYEIENL
jgi:hypothetical protein